MIIYSKSSGLNNATIGKLETPIKMVIEHESDVLTKKGGICVFSCLYFNDWLQEGRPLSTGALFSTYGVVLWTSQASC